MFVTVCHCGPSCGGWPIHVQFIVPLPPGQVISTSEPNNYYGKKLDIFTMQVPYGLCRLFLLFQGPNAWSSPFLYTSRTLAVVDGEGKLVTGREFPLLTQLNANVVDGVATLSSKNHPEFSLNLRQLIDNDRQKFR